MNPLTHLLGAYATPSGWVMNIQNHLCSRDSPAPQTVHRRPHYGHSVSPRSIRRVGQPIIRDLRHQRFMSLANDLAEKPGIFNHR